MSARQAFIPRSQSRANTSTPNNGQSTNLVVGDTYPAIAMNVNRPQASLDTEKTTETASNGDGKIRSLAGLIGRKKGANPVAVRGNGPGPGPGQEQMLTPRRSFDGIRRPEITPMSIIPYPTPHHDTFAGSHIQTPRKAMPQGAFAFPTPASRGMKNGVDGHGDDREEGDKANQKGLMLFGGGDNESNLDTGGSGPGYMRVFSRSGSGGAVARPGSGEQRSFGTKIATPLPGYGRAVMEMDTPMEMDDTGGEMYARPLEGIQEEGDHGDPNGGGDASRTLRRVKRGLDREQVEREEDDIARVESRKGHWSAKRTRHDLQEEYTRLSSPRMPPTPAPPMPPPVDDDHLTLASVFENVGEFVNEEEFERMCKRWTECTREEWLKGTEGALVVRIEWRAEAIVKRSLATSRRYWIWSRIILPSRWCHMLTLRLLWERGERTWTVASGPCKRACVTSKTTWRHWRPRSKRPRFSGRHTVDAT